MITSKKNSWKTRKTEQSWVEIRRNSRASEYNPESNVSVITKTTNPKIVIQSESFDKDGQWDLHKHTLLKFICLIIMYIIILITFFISIKTFDMVKDLTQYTIK